MRRPQRRAAVFLLPLTHLLIAVLLAATAVLSPIGLSSAQADESEQVRQLAKSNIDRVIEILRTEELSRSEREKRILDTINPLFDFALMAKLSLGKEHWSPLSAKQREDFVAVFVLRLQESYLDKLGLYTDENVVVQEAQMVKERIHVVTHLVSQDDKKEMIYKLYKSEQGWKIYDMEILGVSVVQTYRSQFSGFLKDRSFAELMTQLRDSGTFTPPAAQKN